MATKAIDHMKMKMAKPVAAPITCPSAVDFHTATLMLYKRNHVRINLSESAVERINTSKVEDQEEYFRWVAGTANNIGIHAATAEFQVVAKCYGVTLETLLHCVRRHGNGGKGGRTASTKVPARH